MTNESIRSAVRAEPFRPFAIRLADGRAFAVRHPEFVFSPPSSSVIVVFEPDDSYDMIDVRLVTSLDFESPDRNEAG